MPEATVVTIASGQVRQQNFEYCVSTYAPLMRKYTNTCMHPETFIHLPNLAAQAAEVGSGAEQSYG